MKTYKIHGRYGGYSMFLNLKSEVQFANDQKIDNS